MPGSEAKSRFYGWINFSGNISTSDAGRKTQNGNFPLIYDLRPNRMELNQIVLYIERLPDEAQTDHIDWGFRVSFLYGLDYRFTFSRGWLSDQLLKHNSYYGFDTPMVYFDLYIPYVFQGMNIRIGRIISEPDIEAQLAPNNLMASHSLLYGFDHLLSGRNFHHNEDQRSVDDPGWNLRRHRRRHLAGGSWPSTDRHCDGAMDRA